MRQKLTRILPYQPRQLFELVGDVERYPEFVPWVMRLATAKRSQGPDGVAQFEADAEVGFSIIHERFATRVRLDPHALTVDVELISGPFRELRNRWRFSARGRATELDFVIDFEFRSRVLGALFAVNAPRAIARLVDCFEARALKLYGPGALAPP